MTMPFAALQESGPGHIPAIVGWIVDGQLRQQGFNLVPVTPRDQSPRLGSTSPSSINPCCRF
jgi:hypothetical protein